MVLRRCLELINERSYIVAVESPTQTGLKVASSVGAVKKSLFMCVLALSRGWLAEMKSGYYPHVNLKIHCKARCCLFDSLSSASRNNKMLNWTFI